MATIEPRGRCSVPHPAEHDAAADLARAGGRATPRPRVHGRRARRRCAERRGRPPFPRLPDRRAGDPVPPGPRPIGRGHDSPGGDRLWVIDPLDGSREYGEGREDWAVHVALVPGGRRLVGAVALPARGIVLGDRRHPAPLAARQRCPAWWSAARVRRPWSPRWPNGWAPSPSPWARPEPRSPPCHSARPRSTSTPAASTSGTRRRRSRSPSPPGCTPVPHRRLALALRPPRPWLPDLLVCHPTLAEAGARGVGRSGVSAMVKQLTHLQRLEAESIQIMREAVAESERPGDALLDRQGQLGHAAPGPQGLLPLAAAVPAAACRHHLEIPGHVRVPRRRMAARARAWSCSSTRTPSASSSASTRSTHGSALHTDMWKTQGLKQALDQHGFDAAFGGARRDEEKSRAKERIFSLRSAQHRWDPEAQRPELWRLYNVPRNLGETHAGLPPVELDRARHLAVHPPGGDPHRAALPGRAAAGRGTRRHADHGRRRPDAAGARGGARAEAASASAPSAATRSPARSRARPTPWPRSSRRCC